MCAFARIYPLLISKFLSILKEASTKYVVLSCSIMEIEVSFCSFRCSGAAVLLESVMQLHAVWQILVMNLSAEYVLLIFKVATSNNICIPRCALESSLYRNVFLKEKIMHLWLAWQH